MSDDRHNPLAELTLRSSFLATTTCRRCHEVVTIMGCRPGQVVELSNTPAPTVVCVCGGVSLLPEAHGELRGDGSGHVED